MTDKELIQALRGTETRSKRGLLDEAADRLEELSQRVPQWIPVTERLPDDDVGDWCIVYVEGLEGYVYYCGAVICADYDHSTGNFFDGSLCITNLVRYWMPMPEPPGEELL